MRKAIALLLFTLLVVSCANVKHLNDKTMSTIDHKNPKKLFDPTPYAFCHSTHTVSKGSLIFISGQSGAEDLQHTLSDDFRTQAHYALVNLKTVLEDHNLTPEDVLKITVLIVDHNQDKLTIWTQEMREIWKNQKYPASTLIPVPRLALESMLIEVDAIAFTAKK